jgi:hypothetical protein
MSGPIKLDQAAKQIILKMGLRANVDKTSASNSGVQGEPAYTTNDKRLWIHDGTSFCPLPTLDMALVDEDGSVLTDEDFEILYEA